jgi:hypothetical protein
MALYIAEEEAAKLTEERHVTARGEVKGRKAESETPLG